jgi:hypothetical protein
LLVDKPQVYNLPERPNLPRERVAPAYAATALAAVALGLATAVAFLAGGRGR